MDSRDTRIEQALREYFSDIGFSWGDSDGCSSKLEFVILDKKDLDYDLGVQIEKHRNTIYLWAKEHEEAYIIEGVFTETSIDEFNNSEPYSRHWIDFIAALNKKFEVIEISLGEESFE
jgi:hypothetical protein